MTQANMKEPEVDVQPSDHFLVLLDVPFRYESAPTPTRATPSCSPSGPVAVGSTPRSAPSPSPTCPPRGADVYLLGGGEDAALPAAARWLLRHRLREALACAPAVLAVCAGFQLLGGTITDQAGRVVQGLELLDVDTVPGPRRAVGEVVASATIAAMGELTGFENHRGQTTLGPGVQPLAVPTRGTGNGTSQHGRPSEGARSGPVVGTYLHGPVLARNPALADHLLRLATGLDQPTLELPDQEPLRRAYLDLPTRARPGRGLPTRRRR
jgi:CobQ-like glutamine amidotransferase family enzyme